MLDGEIVSKLSENLPFKIDTDFGINSVVNKEILLFSYRHFIIKVQKSPNDPDEFSHDKYVNRKLG